MRFDNAVLHKLWDAELEIMDVIHEMCETHGIKYSLGFGSLIGAVRHKGFIPWDDDIDIIMPREDYDKFISVWQETDPEGYILQNKDSESDFAQNFTKIIKDKTAFIQLEEEKAREYHKGIFVDIAPCDRVPKRKLARVVHYLACAIDLLFSKEYTSDSGGILGVVEKTLMKLPKKLRPKLRHFAERIMKHWNSRKDFNYICTDTIQNCKRYYPSDVFNEFERVDFQGRKYWIVKDYHSILSVRYGDYMQLPPEEERVWKHHPILIDFDHNYEELVKCREK